MIATSERSYVEEYLLYSKVIEEPNTTSNVKEPVQRSSMPGITPLKVVLLGLILDGSIPILQIVS